MKLANCFFGKVVFLLFLLCFVLISANAQIKKAEAVSSYFYNKYTTQQVNRYTDNGSWSYLGTSHSGAQGYSNYGFSPVTGYTTSGSWISAPNASAGATYYGIGDAKTLYKYVAVGSAWWNYYDNGWEYDQEQYQKTATVTLVDAQGTLVQSNIVALDGTYPNNGKHSDGYWYIKGSVVNNAPSIEVINPTNNQTFSNMPTYNSLHISGSSQDLDVGNTITIKYQIDSGTPQTIQTLVSNGMSQIFGPLNIAVSSSLTEGSHILKVWAEDNFNDQSSITTRTFNVDRTAPTIPELSLVSKTETNVKLAWTSSTDVSGISKYDVYHGTMLLATVTDTTYTVQWLTPGTAYNFSIIAVDNAGNVTSSNILNVTTSDETPPTPPTGLSVLNKTLSSIQLSWTPSIDNVGVMEYQVYNKGIIIGSVNSTTYTVSGLTYSAYGTVSPTYQFTIKAKDAAGNESNQSEVLLVTTLPDSPEADDISAEAIPILYNSTYSAYLSVPADIDFYRYTALGSGIDQLVLSAPLGKSYELYVYDPNMKLIAIGSSLTNEILFKVSAGQTYYIKVFSDSGDYGTSTYSLNVTRSILRYQTEYQYDSNGNLIKKITTLLQPN